LGIFYEVQVVQDMWLMFVKHKAYFLMLRYRWLRKQAL